MSQLTKYFGPLAVALLVAALAEQGALGDIPPPASSSQPAEPAVDEDRPRDASPNPSDAVQPAELQRICDFAMSRYSVGDLNKAEWRELRKTAREAIREHRREALDSHEARRLLAKLRAFMAVANLKLGNKQDAQRSFEDAAKHDATLFVCLNNAGVLYFDARNYLKAIERFEDAAQCLVENPSLVKLKPLYDATPHRSDGRTSFETIVDNLSEALHAYETDAQQRCFPTHLRKIADAQQLLSRLESALQQNKPRMVRRGTSWLTARKDYERGRAQLNKEREIQRAQRSAESLRRRGEDTLLRAKDFERRVRRNYHSRTRAHYEQLQRREMDRAKQLAGEFHRQLREIEDMKAELEALRAGHYSGHCEPLGLEDDPSF